MGGIGRHRVDSAVCSVVIEEVASCKLKHIVAGLWYLPTLFEVLNGLWWRRADRRKIGHSGVEYRL
jgi:hypothetical protein